jgi:hypothetical protein
MRGIGECETSSGSPVSRHAAGGPARRGAIVAEQKGAQKKGEQQRFDEWAILELMGHRRLAGKVSEAQIGGSGFIRIDVPGKEGWKSSQFYSPAAVYCITPTTELVAREVASFSSMEPIHAWEFNRGQLRGVGADDGEDGE